MLWLYKQLRVEELWTSFGGMRYIVVISEVLVCTFFLFPSVLHIYANIR